MGLAPALESHDDAPRRWAAWALPWLLSATTHLTLLLFLALTFAQHQGVGARVALTTGISLDVHLISRSPLDADQRADGVELTQSTSRSFFDDENEPSPTPAPTAAPVAAASEGGPLASVLDEQPPVNLVGILPAAASGAGPGELAGQGVGSAQRLATLSRPAGGANKIRGGYARTGVFGVVGEGQKFVYVFDRSGSMAGHGGLPLSMAKAELISSLRDLGQVHQFQIIFYNEHPRIFSPAGSPGRLVFGTEQNKTQAQKFVGGITADGATQHEEALTAALRMGPDVIFFLTDADEPRMSQQQMARIARMNHGTAINAVEFGYGPQSDANNFLVQLAHQNGGQHVYVDVSRLSRSK